MTQFESTNDQRTDDNTMRHQYRTLTEKERAQVDAVKSKGDYFLKLIDTIASSYPEGKGPRRELALARTKIEEAVMWAVKGITK